MADATDASCDFLNKLIRLLYINQYETTGDISSIELCLEWDSHYQWFDGSLFVATNDRTCYVLPSYDDNRVAVFGGDDDDDPIVIGELEHDDEDQLLLKTVQTLLKLLRSK